MCIRDSFRPQPIHNKPVRAITVHRKNRRFIRGVWRGGHPVSMKMANAIAPYSAVDCSGSSSTNLISSPGITLAISQSLTLVTIAGSASAQSSGSNT